MADPTFVATSDRTLLVVFGDEISDAVHEEVFRFVKLIESNPELCVSHVQPSYASVSLSFSPLQQSHADLESKIRPLLSKTPGRGAGTDRPLANDLRAIIELPVCYEGNCALDLQEVARHCGLSCEEVISLHSSAIYKVYFLGFMPGFGYFGGLPPALQVPRRASPRPHVPAGSVGIGGNQTGVYPLVTPGGWQIIGRTPERIFDTSREPMSLFKMGDRVKFNSIMLQEYERLVRSGVEP